MKGLLAVARRELRDRAFVLAGAAAAGLLALAAPLAPGFGRMQPQDVRGAASGMLLVALVGVLSAVLGATAFPLSASDRRMGFYYARPMQGWILWLGKTGVAFVLLSACGALILSPTWIADVLVGDPSERVWRGAASGWPLLLLFPAGHLGALVVRSRSSWLLADVVTACVFVGVVAHVVLRTASFGMDHVATSTRILTAAIATGITLASLASVALGRLEIHRARSHASVTFWTCALAGLAAMTGHWRWAANPAPDDFERIQFLAAAPDGPWVAATGTCRGSLCGFLVNVETGATASLDPFPTSLIEYDEAGTVAAWFAPDGGVQRLTTADLSTAQPTVEHTAFALPGHAAGFRLSPSAARAAVWSGEGLAVTNLADGTRLDLPDLELGGLTNVRFEGEDELWLMVARTEGQHRLTQSTHVIDLQTRRVTRETVWSGLQARRSCPTATQRDGDRVVLEPTGTRITLRDGWTGAIEATLVELPPEVRCTVGLLDDDTIVVATSLDANSRVLLFSERGEPLRDLEVTRAGAGPLSLGAEVRPGEFYASVEPAPWSPTDSSLFRIDAASGQVQEVAADLRPAATLRNDLWARKWLPAEVGAPASRLFLGLDQSTLYRLDEETGTAVRIAGGSG